MRIASLLLITSCLVILAPSAQAQMLGTAFTYQGQLTEGGQPANGLYDMQACLFDSPLSPMTIVCAPDFGDVPVEDGVFTIALDFGAAPFAGLQRFIELRIRQGASTGSYTVLSPRQLVRPTPEALRAAAASTAPWSGLTGIPAGLADGIDNDSGGTVTSVIAGTGLSGGTITASGTISIANGGVGSAQIADGGVAAIDVAADSLGAGQIASSGVAADELADNAVDTASVQNLSITRPKIAAGAIGVAQIDTTQVQARISGACLVGEYFRGVNPDGTVACEPLPGVPRNSVVDDPASIVGPYTSLAIGADGLPVISYWDLGAGALKVAKCGNAACTSGNQITTVDDPANPVGLYTSIAIGADGLPVVSYYDDVADSLKVAKCGNGACTSGNQITVVDDPVNDVGRFSSIAIGTDGLPVISYRDATLSALKVAKCGNAACSSGNQFTIVDDQPVNQVAGDTAIAVPADGRPVIAYTDQTAGRVKVVRCGNAACTSGNEVTALNDPASAVGDQVAIAIGSDGRPVIAYHDLAAGALKVAKCGNPACSAGTQLATVDDPVGSVGTDVSIALGSDGMPVISYQDGSTAALKVARCGNAACSANNQVGTVDDPSSTVGDDTSIAIGPDALPVISHFDSTDGTLRVVKCGTRSCQ